MFASEENKFLKLRSGVELTEGTDERIHALDPDFEEYPCEVTNALRSAQHQLDIIKQKCSNHGFPIPDATVNDIGSWLEAWGKLLVLQDIVNSPIPARAPFDYVKPNGEKRSAGNLIGISAHMTGHAFDIGGFNQELKVSRDLKRVQAIVLAANENSGGVLIADTLIEPVNGCLHIDCKESKLNNF